MDRNKLVNFLLTVKCQLISANYLNQEYHHLVTMMVKVNLVEKNQWMLKLVSKSRNRNMI